MTGYPGGPLDARLELQLGGAWTDITPYALPDGAQEAVITSGRSDGAQQASPASLPMTWDNSDGRFSPRNAASPYYGQLRQNTPARVSVASPYGNYLRLEDPGGTSCVQCPDSAAFTATGALDVRLDLDLDDWQSQTTLVTKWNSGTDKAWAFWLGTDGRLVFEWWDGTTNRLDAAVLPLPSGRRTARATWSGSGGNHTVAFWHGPSPAGPWTTLGTVTGTGSTAPAHTAAPLAIGFGAGYITGDAGHAGQDLGGIKGSVWGFQLYVDGTLKSGPDFSAYPAGSGGITDPQGHAWSFSGGAEISDRDYRLHGELSSLVPSVTSSKTARAAATVSGLLSRLQQGDAPPAGSPLRRALAARPGTLAPAAYWACEDPAGASSLASDTGGPPMTWDTAPQLASDTAFAASAPLPVLGGSRWLGRVPSYSGAGQIITRFVADLQTPPSSTSCLVRMSGTGTVYSLAAYVDASRNVILNGLGPGGVTVFNLSMGIFAAGTYWFSLEMRPSGGNVLCSLAWMQPAAPYAFGSAVQTVAGTVGAAQYVRVNPDGGLTDTAVGHITVQSDWETLYGTLQPALNAYAGEPAASRFTRIAGEQGIRSRVYGAPDLTQPMGPQAPGTAWDLLQECEAADQGLICEPRGDVAIGYRTLASMTGQDAAVTLDYSLANLPGDAQAAEDAQNLINDWTVSRPDGSSARAVLDDGSAKSISSPEDGGAGQYQSTAQANVAADGQLQDAAGWRLNLSAADEARYRQIGADFGTPGAPAADLARLRTGDVVTVRSPPAALQTRDIRAVVTGAAETLGPGRGITWDTQPAAPYVAGVFDDPVTGRADTDGSQLSSPATAGAVTLSVATTGPSGILWTTSAADFPFDADIAGEQVTVTNITGSSSPQTFTVVRSVNGVSKAQASGADVRMWTRTVFSPL